jgi:hypothetical protein
LIPFGAVPGSLSTLPGYPHAPPLKSMAPHVPLPGPDSVRSSHVVILLILVGSVIVVGLLARLIGNALQRKGSEMEGRRKDTPG